MIIADKTELIQKEAIISEYDYRVQEQQDEIVLLNGDVKKLHENIALMERDFDAEEQALKNELSNA